MLVCIEGKDKPSAELAYALVIGAAESPGEQTAGELVVSHIGEKSAHAHECVYLGLADGARHLNLEVAVSSIPRTMF